MYKNTFTSKNRIILQHILSTFSYQRFNQLDDRDQNFVFSSSQRKTSFFFFYGPFKLRGLGKEVTPHGSVVVTCSNNSSWQQNFFIVVQGDRRKNKQIFISFTIKHKEINFIIYIIV